MSNPFEREQKKRDLKKAQKYLKRNREDRKPRQRRWEVDDFEEEYTLPDERIMPRDEQDRRNGVSRMVSRLKANDLEEPITPPEPVAEHQDFTQGRVLEVSSSLCRVQTAEGVWKCGLKGSLSYTETGYTNVVAVGDWVVVEGDGVGGGMIMDVLPRRSRLARPDSFYSHLQQVIAANVDQLLIVASWREPHLWTELVDRYLIAADLNGVKPIICINKIDLASRHKEIDDYRLPYQSLGYRVILSSIVTGRGIDDLRDLLTGRTTVLAGLSGVGKSSLLTAVQPDFDLKTGVVSELSGDGRHTTTQAIMLPFGTEGYVIDTPGIREFALAGLQQGEVIRYYPELLPFAAQCRFRNCTHFHEPECAVRSAAEHGELPEWRYENYQDIFMAAE